MVEVNYIEQVAAAIASEVDGSLLPETDTDSLFLLYSVLCLVKGTAVTRRDVHDAWSAWMTLRGERHKSLVPYRDLPPEVRAEDGPFVQAIRRVAEKVRP